MSERARATSVVDNYRTIFDAANDAMFVHDPHSGSILDVNRKMCELFGYTYDEAIRLDVGDISVGDEQYNRDRAHELIRTAAAGEPLVFEWHARHRSGRAFWVEVNLKDVRIGGEPRLLAVVRDVTERRWASEALATSEARYRQVVEDIPEFVCRFKPDTTIIFANEAYANSFGCSVEDLVGRKFIDLIPEEEHEAVRAHLAGLGPDRPIHTVEHRAVTAGGEVRWQRWKDRALLDAQRRVIEFQSIGQDVTDQRRAQEALRESEARLRSITENSPDHIMLLDLDGTIEFINRTVPDLDRERVLGTKIFQYVHERFHEVMRACFRRVLETGLPDGYEVEYDAADGSVRTFEARVGPVVSGGEVVAFAVSASDVTERKRAAEELEQGKRYFQLLAQSSPSIVFRADADGSPVYVNDRWHEVTGLPEGSWRHGGWARAVHSRDRDAVLEAWRQAVRERRPWQREFRFRHANGDSVWVLGAALPVPGGDRSDGGFIGTCTDITRLKAAEAATAESEERFRQLTEAINDIFWLTDWDRRQVIYVSPSYKWIWGRTCQSLYDDPRSWSENIHEEDRERATTAFYRDAERGQYDIEYRIVRPDGEIRWIHDKAFPVRDARGRIYRMAGVSEDVTERIEAQDELRRTSERERLLRRELDHRVRNNLSSLITLIDLTRRSGADTASFAQAIAGRVHAMATVHGLLSRSERPQVELSDLCRSLLPPDTLGVFRCEGDPVQVSARQSTSVAMVVHELLTNSVKHGALGRGGGRVDLSWSSQEIADGARRVSLEWRERGGPEIAQPPVPGVGTSLIEGLVRCDLKGRAELTYPRGGAEHRIVMALESHAADPIAGDGGVVDGGTADRDPAGRDAVVGGAAGGGGGR